MGLQKQDIHMFTRRIITVNVALIYNTIFKQIRTSICQDDKPLIYSYRIDRAALPPIILKWV